MKVKTVKSEEVIGFLLDESDNLTHMGKYREARALLEGVYKLSKKLVLLEDSARIAEKLKKEYEEAIGYREATGEYRLAFLIASDAAIFFGEHVEDRGSERIVTKGFAARAFQNINAAIEENMATGELGYALRKSKDAFELAWKLGMEKEKSLYREEIFKIASAIISAHPDAFDRQTARSDMARELSDFFSLKEPETAKRALLLAPKRN